MGYFVRTIVPMISLQETYQKKHILIAGATGFIGKVALAYVFEHLPQIDKIYCLMRGKKECEPVLRFENMINDSYVFQKLHEIYEKDLSEIISEKIIILEGEVTQLGLGLSLSDTKMLSKNLDLLINCTGLVDFNPDVRDAIDVNINGALNCADFVSKCNKAKLIHVSTCYVSGKINGDIKEEVIVNQTPTGQTFDPREELLDLKLEVEAIKKNHDRLSVEVKKMLKNAMVDLGKQRAHQLGWTNTYTYTKALAEKILKLNYPNISFSILRPSIVESALEFPFPGWNEGFNTCGPLAKIFGTWFRFFPAKKENLFDVIPVDQVVKSIFIIGAHLLIEKNKEVYHVGSSDLNPLTIGQAADLTSQSHAFFYRLNGKNFIEKYIRPYWRVKCVEGERRFFDHKNLKKILSRARDVTSKNKIFNKIDDVLRDNIKKMDHLEMVLNLFKPFILDFNQTFVTKNIFQFEIKEKKMQFCPEIINWKNYWLNVHMPGLRKWCFPVFDKKSAPKLDPAVRVSLKSHVKINDLKGA